MLTKRSWIVILCGLNLLLLAGVLLESRSPAMAFAQGGAQRGDLISVTAKVAPNTTDTLYVLDVPARKLYAFYPGSGRSNKLTAAPPRDLVKDFNR